MKKNLLVRNGAPAGDGNVEPMAPNDPPGVPCIQSLFDAVRPRESAIVRDPEPCPSPPPRDR